MFKYPLPFRDVKKKLEKNGFQIISQKGSHIKFVKYTAKGTITAIVPKHKEISIGTIKSILKQAFLTEEEFFQI